VTDMEYETDIRRVPGMRVLVAFEDVRRLYRDVFVQAIRELRPAHTVRSASLAEIERVLGRFAPHMVVCSQPKGAHPPGSGAWVHIPTGDGLEEGEQLAEICLDGDRWRTEGPSLSELLAIIDETYKRLCQGSLSGSC
jgi:hypothetical protein